MNHILRIVFVVVISGYTSFAQAPAFSFCGKSGDCSMTWDEFTACKKELITTDKNVSISSFVLTIKKAQKKDFVFVEYPANGNTLSKASVEMIEKLHKDKKLGDKLEIGTVEVVQSGKAAKKVTGMVITLKLE